MKLIPLTQGKFAVVDDADFEWLSQWKWYAQKASAGKSFYVCRRLPYVDGKRGIAHMHRVIVGIDKSDPRHVDHIIPGETLDNRRSNLRIATSTENGRNRKIQPNNTSGFKGVCRHGKRRGWRASIGLNGKQRHLGYRPTAEQAYRELYVPAAIAYYGEFACL